MAKPLPPLREDFPNIRAALALKMPFAMSIVAKRPLILTDELPTCAVDEAANIYINPTFFNSATFQECVFLLAHEAMHIMLAHFGRGKGRDHKLWNYCGDAVINAILDNKKVGRVRHQDCVWIPNALSKTTEELYNEKVKEWEEKKKKAGDSSTGWEGTYGEETFQPDVLDGDCSDGIGSPKKVTAEQRREISDVIASAIHTADTAGGLPESIAREINRIRKPKASWAEQLASLLTCKVKDDYSWSRPNRRFVSRGLYLPSLDGNATGYIVVAVDTSGSIGQKELDEFAGHIQYCLEVLNPESIKVIYCDTQVNNVEVFERGSELKLKPCGGGGTNFYPVFDHVNESSDYPQVLIYITDGQCADKIDEQEYPVVWLTTDRTDLSPGMVIKI